MVDIKILVYAILKDDGITGVSSAEAEMYMSDVKTYFLDYQINIDYCIKEVHSTYIYNNHKIFPKLCENPSYVLFKLHEDCEPPLYICGNGGQNKGWSILHHKTIIHELGHVFGLPHTFNNNEHRNSSCLQNPVDCAETVNHKNCDINTNAPLTCEIEGDGFCDTPADPYCIDQSTRTICPFYTVDRCGVSYPSVLSPILTSNMMSYYWGDLFTEDQTDHMHGYITTKYQYALGIWSNCNSSPTTGEELGYFNSFKLYENQTIEFKNGLNAKNCNIFFKNCLVKVSGEIELDNVLLLFDENTVFDAGAPEVCTGGVSSTWRGFILTNSSLLGYSGSILNTNPFAIENKQGTSSLVMLSDVDIPGNSEAIKLNGQVGLILSNGCNISGTIVKHNTNPYSDGTFAYFAQTHFFDTKISFPTQDLFNTGIDLLNSNLTFENSELKNFGLGIICPGEGVVIKKSNFKSIGDVAIYCSNNTLFHLENSYLNNTYASAVNPTSHSIFNNNFGNSPYEGLYLSNQDDAPHSIHNNIFTNNNIGMISQGKQTGLKMLCNKMSNTSRNFNWQNDVHPIQGKDIGIASGNLFGNNAIHITGSSSVQIRYFYNKDISAEEPINVSHNNFIKIPIDLDAQCGPIGPDWTPPALPPGCPTGIDCTKPCPAGIDCTQPCPPGINCLQPCPVGIICTAPCPPGINCTLPCPPGIDCTVPCPPNVNCTPVNPNDCPQGIDCTQPCPVGIDCTQPCPPGIDCTQPCPPGINCTQPCPLGIDCYTACPAGINCTQICPPGVNCKQPCTLPGGCHESCFTCISHTDTIIKPTDCYDPLMGYLNSKYQTLNTDYLQTSIAHKSLPGYSTLAGLLNNQSETNKKDIKDMLTAHPNMLGLEEIKMIFGHSEIYTESEVVQLIKLNPSLLMDADIADVIFHSQSFTAASINEIKQHFALNQNSPLIAQFALLDGKKSKVYALLDYALYRLIYQSKNHCTDYITWLSRYESLSAKFRLIDHYVMRWQPSSALAIHQAIVANPTYTMTQKDDAIQYKQITDIISSAFDSDRNLNQLTKQEQDQLALIANSGTRYSKSKARGILSALYEHHFDPYTTAEPTADKIYFLGQPLIPRSFRDTELRIYPNPASETVHIDIQKDGNYNIDMANVAGQKVLSTTLTKGGHTIDVKHFTPGVYYYTIQSTDGKIKDTDKLIIIK
ncbi:MAG TPA: T9SS type A sorting domain-containing protein [Saprospiraceae bacterium]|nr:T9SS type A sorting domain-containing protein [Saprospiraceae bacterium]HMT70656.1 T9SS type A sorting domain-containing protein [Saprospiraceae bacterium]HRG41500.1 T9SS type A sorting domain-containing protein [Saprospiraceae bacterium]